MKFLVDMPLSPAVAAWLRRRSHDALHVAELGLAHAADVEILEHARREGQVVVTADLDYPRLLALAQLEAPGVILFRGGNYSELETLNRLERTLEVVPEADLPHSIIVIDKSRIRQRRLPL